MKYTKYDLDRENYFIVVKGNKVLRDFLIKEFSISYNGDVNNILSLSIGENAGWMGDDGKYYKKQGYTEVFSHELTFLNYNYEIY